MSLISIHNINPIPCHYQKSNYMKLFERFSGLKFREDNNPINRIKYTTSGHYHEITNYNRYRYNNLIIF